MSIDYTFGLIRYVHDVVAGEFVNVGVVLYAPAISYARGLYAENLGRVSCMFPDADTRDLRQVIGFVREKVEELGAESLCASRPNRHPEDVADLLLSVIPQDDSALQFVHAGGGATSDPDMTLSSLFVRYVGHHTPSTRLRGRSDRSVWNAFRSSFERWDIMANLHSHRIDAPGISHKFSHAWKNGTWRCFEPLSFDVADAQKIEDKAIRWLGRATGLARSREPFMLFYLLGAPGDSALRGAFDDAMLLLGETPTGHRMVTEDEAEDFARELQREMAQHRG
jgi:hypothetical protein